MESLYYVVSWLCHRTCEHCYEDRFRPYYGANLDRVVSLARGNFARVIANLPERLSFRYADEDSAEHKGRVILAGGEVLLEPVRESVLYAAMDLLWRKYEGAVKLVVQTTGDLLTPRIVTELLAHRAWCISVSGIDHWHAGLEEPEAQAGLRTKLTAMLEEAGLTYGNDMRSLEPGPFYHFFGATPDAWIGKLWPRGRAWSNELSTADIDENFCARWSGGMNFLDAPHAGSEVSIDPDGNVYPCCLKTRVPIGNLLDEPLETMLDRARRSPVYRAISAGRPEAMGLQHGWSVERYLENCAVTLPSGRIYRNLCVGCDRFHEEVLRPGSELVQLQ